MFQRKTVQCIVREIVWRYKLQHFRTFISLSFIKIQKHSKILKISEVMWAELDYPCKWCDCSTAVVVKFWAALIPVGMGEQWQPPSAGPFRIAPITEAQNRAVKTFKILTLRQICEILPQLGWKLKHAISAEKSKSVKNLRLDKTRL